MSFVKKINVLNVAFLFCLSFSASSQIVNIPDANFKEYLIKIGVDTNNDGDIQLSEAETATFLAIPSIAILSFEGIQSFTSLEHLSYDTRFSEIEVFSEIDLSNNINLKWLSLAEQHIETIDLSQNVNLEYLNLSSTLLSTIDLSNNINLERLFIVNMSQQGPGISNLDLSANSNLKQVNLAFCNLSFLNIQNGNNTNLEALYTGNNPLLTCIQVDDKDYVYPDCIFGGSHPKGWCVDRCTLSENCELGSNNLDCEKILVYPNPTADILTIDTTEQIEFIQIFDMSGSIVYRRYGDTNTINISKLASGVYFLKLQTVSDFYSQKLILE